MGSEESVALIGEVRWEVQTILNWSDSTIRASQRLLEFSHRLRAEEDDIDLNIVVSKATDLIRDRCEREEILLLHDPDRTIPMVVGRSGQLLQVVLNVIQNAREADRSEWRRALKVAVSASRSRTVDRGSATTRPSCLNRRIRPRRAVPGSYSSFHLGSKIHQIPSGIRQGTIAESAIRRMV